MRSQMMRLSDILPTILDVAGIAAPTPLDGVSIASTSADAKARPVHEPLDGCGVARLSVPKPSVGGGDPNRTNCTYFAGVFRLADTAHQTRKIVRTASAL
jgi:arylsulfatase A-like enzyme